MTQTTPLTKIIEIVHGNGSVQTLEVPYDTPEDSMSIPKPISIEDIQQADLAYRVVQSEQYLKDTDWYVYRKMETNVDIPEDVLQLRQEAREFISANRTSE